MANDTEHRNAVEVLGEEFLDRRRRGESASMDEYAAAHPDLAEQIRQLFPAMLAMEQLKTCRFSSSGRAVEMRVEGLERLGDYRIIREIGRGGMGVVYEAEQQSLGRRVAVKVFPRQTLGDSRQLKRFHREARTAASLHHTNIVPVFGVGEQEGMHYYVMQRIDGVALDEVIKGALQATECPDEAEASANDASPAARTHASVMSSIIESTSKRWPKLAGSHANEYSSSPRTLTELTTRESRRSRSHWHLLANVGIQVGDALTYAHAQGVLHRDIKPSNLLLDPHGTVWVTDFGLATVLESERLSNPGDLVGTLRFMAPEHVHGQQDARSDIYSLGLTLYELLTLRPAFDEPSRARMIHKILSGEAPPPRSLRPEIPRDLEAIVIKAMSRDPKKRYGSAAAMASDLRRFVEDRPVRARHITSFGRLWRWTRRNPAIASLSAALLVVVLSSFILISSKWREAVVENGRAEDNLSVALESLDHILDRFASNWMSHPTATEDGDGEATSGFEFQMAASDYNAAVLQDALKLYDRFAKQNATNPQLQRDTAKAHRRVAQIYERLGQYAKAEEAYKRALAILDSQQIGKDTSLAIEKARLRNQLGLTMYATSRFAEAEVEFRRASAILSTAPDSDAPECQAELARTSNNLGQALALMQRRDEARQSHQRAVGVLESLVRHHGHDTDYRLALARAYRTYYPFAILSKRPREHERIRAAGISILEELVRDFPNVPDYQCELSEMLATTANRGRDSQSIDLQASQLRRAIDLARHLSQAYPSIPRYRAVLARALKRHGDLLNKTRHDEADLVYGESVALYRTLTQDFPDVPAYHIFLASALQDYAQNLQELERPADSRLALEQAIAEQQTYVELRPDNHFGKRVLARLYEQLAETLVALGSKEAADQALQEARRLWKDLGTRNDND